MIDATKHGEILLPWPARELSPNARSHWAKKHRAAKAQKRDAEMLARQAGYSRIEWPETGRLCVWITGYAADKRRRDVDNLLASCKHGLDAIAGVMGVDDSRFVPRPYISEETRQPPVVRIVVTAMPEANR